jgi:hypothetical protein
MTKLERVLESLGSRVKQTKQGFVLDGKPCNTEKIFKAAGISYDDE